MKNFRRNPKQDENAAGIVRDLRDIGATVEYLSRCRKGVPDLLVGFRGKNYLLEVKRPGEKLEKHQAEWAENWRGIAFEVHNTPEAFAVIGVTRSYLASAGITLEFERRP